jgi:hypothetical protein
MFPQASIDVGCGKFSWSIEKAPPPPPPPAKPTLSERKCHDRHKHADVHKEVVDIWTLFGCTDTPMKAGDAETYWHPNGFSDLHQNYKVSWIEGCTTTKEQNIRHPIEGDGDINCAQLLKNNYYRCKLEPTPLLSSPVSDPQSPGKVERRRKSPLLRLRPRR